MENMKEKQPNNTNHAVKRSLEESVKPWLKFAHGDLIESAQALSFSVLEISRRTRLSPDRVIDETPRQLQTDGVVFETGLEIPKRIPGIKKLIRNSVKEPPIKGVRNGGRRLNEGLLQRKIREGKRKRAKIVFRATDGLSKEDANSKRRQSIHSRMVTRWTNKVSVSETVPTLEVAKQALVKVEELLLLSPKIIAAKWNHLDALFLPKVVRLAVEFCPLYLSGTTLESSQVDPNPQEENDVVKSRVGNKWIAAKLAIKLIKDVLQRTGCDLTIQAIFADIGVLLAGEEQANPTVVEKHWNLYQRLLKDFCKNANVDLEFCRLSAIKPFDQSRVVGNFIIAAQNNGRIDKNIKPEKLLKIVGIQEEMKTMDAKTMEEWCSTLVSLLNASNGNITILKGLVNTYLNYETAGSSDMHLRIEGGSGLLSLRSLVSDLRGDKAIPSLNIMVK